MPERYATPARLPRVRLSCAHTTLHAMGDERLISAPNQRGLDGLDNGVKVGSGSRIWFGSAHVRTPRLARGAELGRVSPAGEFAHPRMRVI